MFEDFVFQELDVFGVKVVERRWDTPPVEDHGFDLCTSAEWRRLGSADALFGQRPAFSHCDYLAGYDQRIDQGEWGAGRHDLF
jgi:hypothetical protein